VDYTLRIDQASEQVIPNLLGALQRQALQVIVTFDLQLARADHATCDCPHHGTERCTCQYAVLLVYDSKQGYGSYRTITVHGRDGQVWLSLLKKSASSAKVAPAYETLETKLLDILLGLVAPSQIDGTAVVELVTPETQSDHEASCIHLP
jgi:hypothetical protein